MMATMMTIFLAVAALAATFRRREEARAAAVRRPSQRRHTGRSTRTGWSLPTQQIR